MSTKNLPIRKIILTETGLRFISFEKLTDKKATEICKILNIKDSYLNRVKSGDIKKPNHNFWEGIRNNFPEWYPYLYGLVNSPPTAAKPSPGSTIDQAAAASPQPNGLRVIETTHADIIKQFKDQDWALEVNKFLLDLERYSPEDKGYIKGLLEGIVRKSKPQKKSNDVT